MSAKGQSKDICAPVPVCQDQAPKCCPDPCAPAPCQDPCPPPDPCCQKQGLSSKGFSGQGGLGGFGFGGDKK